MLQRTKGTKCRDLNIVNTFPIVCEVAEVRKVECGFRRGSAAGTPLPGAVGLPCLDLSVWQRCSYVPRHVPTRANKPRCSRSCVAWAQQSFNDLLYGLAKHLLSTSRESRAPAATRSALTFTHPEPANLPRSTQTALATCTRVHPPRPCATLRHQQSSNTSVSQPASTTSRLGHLTPTSFLLPHRDTSRCAARCPFPTPSAPPAAPFPTSWPSSFSSIPQS